MWISGGGRAKREGEGREGDGEEGEGEGREGIGEGLQEMQEDVYPRF